jgi:hypothetical protein
MLREIGIASTVIESDGNIEYSTLVSVYSLLSLLETKTVVFCLAKILTDRLFLNSTGRVVALILLPRISAQAIEVPCCSALATVYRWSSARINERSL